MNSISKYYKTQEQPTLTPEEDLEMLIEHRIRQNKKFFNTCKNMNDKDMVQIAISDIYNQMPNEMKEIVKEHLKPEYIKLIKLSDKEKEEINEEIKDLNTDEIENYIALKYERK